MSDSSSLLSFIVEDLIYKKPVFVGNVSKQRLTFNVSLPTPSKGGKVAC